MNGKVMDNDNERLIRKTSVAFMCAIIGKFMLMHREAYGSNPVPHEITDFCFHVMQDYDGKEISINSPDTEKFIINCMEKVRTEKHAATEKSEILATNNHRAR